MHSDTSRLEPLILANSQHQGRVRVCVLRLIGEARRWQAVSVVSISGDERRLAVKIVLVSVPPPSEHLAFFAVVRPLSPNRV